MDQYEIETAQRVRRILENVREACRFEAKKARERSGAWLARVGWECVADELDDIIGEEIR